MFGGPILVIVGGELALGPAAAADATPEAFAGAERVAGRLGTLDNLSQGVQPLRHHVQF